jgi:mannosyl-3-phosphoglycerate phosphatase
MGTACISLYSGCAMETRKRTAVRIRPRTRRQLAGEAGSHRFAVFTAVDGTLLDARTFEPGPARPMIQKLHAEGVPVVPVSVMTLDELAPIATDLDLRQAMVIEAGGAIARWTGRGWDVEACGPPAETLLDVVRDIEDRSGASLLIYSALPEPEASRVSGRSGQMLRASTQRRFSEPFVIESGELASIERAAAELGFSVRRGRRFLHLCRECDRGEAFTRVRDELRCEVTIAAGSSMVDAEFLSHADIAIVVPGPDGVADAELLAALPNARVASAPGPSGWAEAVGDVLKSTAPKRRVRRAAS